MTDVQRPGCPNAVDLERAIVAGGPEGDLHQHVAQCSACKQQVSMIRENIEFMRGLVGRLGTNALASVAKAAPAPDAVPGYRLVRKIARGGQGAVYEAIQLDTRRRVAVKIVEAGEEGGSARRRFEREVELAASLRHPNIVTVYHSTALSDGRHALAMEYVEGLRIDDWAANVNAAAPATADGRREAVRIKLQAIMTVCDAVQHAHVNGVIHRDLKPANVLVNPDGTIRVVDFGIARRVSHATRLTRTGSFAGTLAYASPEQVSGRPGDVDTRTDVYSLGLILYELLAAHRPYDTDGSLSGAIANIVSRPTPPIVSLQPGDVPAGAELEAIVSKALAKDRNERYQSASALKRDIENYLSGRAVDARQNSTVYVLRKLASRHRVGFGVAMGMIVVLALIAIIMTWSARRLAHQSSLLSESLSSSTIERGRSVGRNGENARAEALIWPEFFASGADINDPDLLFKSSPAATQAAWALTELYSKQPSLLYIRIDMDEDVLRFEDEGRSVRLVGFDGSQRLISVENGSTLELQPGFYQGSVKRIANAGSGRYAVLIGSDSTPVVDLDTNTNWVWDSNAMPPDSFRDLSADGTRVIEVDSDGRLQLFSVNPLKLVATLATGMSWPDKPCFSPDGHYVTCGVRGDVHAWNAIDGSSVGSWTVPSPLCDASLRSYINTTRMSPDGQHVAAGFNTALLMFNVSKPTAPPMQINPAHRGFVATVDFSKDSKTLISNGSERNVKLWDPATAQLLMTFEHAHKLRAHPVASEDGMRLAVCDRERYLRVIEARPGGWMRRLKDAQHTIHRVIFSPDSSLVLAVSSDGFARVWRTSDSSLARKVEFGSSSLEAGCFSPDGKTVAIAEDDGSIHTFELDNPEKQRNLAQGQRLVTWLSYHPDGRTIVALGLDTQGLVFDARSGKTVRRLVGHAERVAEGAFSPDGRTLYTAGIDGLCIAWDYSTGAERYRTVNVGAAVRAVAVSPDGRLIATGSDDWKIRLWDSRNGELVSTISGARQQVFGLTFHPQGNVLFSCVRDAAIQAWDVRTGRELATLEGHGDLVMSIAISKDGRTLASGSVDHTVGLWNLDYYRPHLKGSAPAWRVPASATSTFSTHSDAVSESEPSPR